jgi:hypothetical protein
MHGRVCHAVVGYGYARHSVFKRAKSTKSRKGGRNDQGRGMIELLLPEVETRAVEWASGYRRVCEARKTCRKRNTMKQLKGSARTEMAT